MHPHEPDLQALQHALGYTFREPMLLLLAVTHSSFAHEELFGEQVQELVDATGSRHNERLEFLGDAVLDVIVSEALLRRHPETREGVLTQKRASLVSTEALAAKGRALGLGRALRVGRSVERARKSMLADTVEALIGAAWLDGGLEGARRVVVTLFGGELEGDLQPEAIVDAMSRLQHLTQGTMKVTPVYEITGSDGPDHAKIFRARVLVNGRPLGSGQGSSKKEAKQEAARAALHSYDDHEFTSTDE